MTIERPSPVPEPTLRRLPAYVHQLRQLHAQGRAVVSASHLARELGFDDTQVRKDVAVAGVVGRPRTGFDVPELLHALEQFLGWANTTDAFLVGVGHLGTALLGYQGFSEHGLHVVAAFDVDPAKVGTRIHGREVLHVDRLPNLAERMHLHLGIVATPPEAAQGVADKMVAGGILAIWNFSPIRLVVPETVVVEEEQLYASLAVLSRKLAHRLSEPS